MNVGKHLVAILAVKRLAGVEPEVDIRKCTQYLPLQKQIIQNPLWLWNPEVSQGIQNKGTRDPKIGYVSAKNIKKEIVNNLSDNMSANGIITNCWRYSYRTHFVIWHLCKCTKGKELGQSAVCNVCRAKNARSFNLKNPHNVK